MTISEVSIQKHNPIGRAVRLKDGTIGVVGDLIKSHGGWTYIISVPIGEDHADWKTHMLKRSEFKYTGTEFDYYTRTAKVR